MYIRAGSTDSVMVSALGINIKILFRLLFSVGAVLAGIAGMMLAPLTSVEPSIGDSFLILSLVIIIIGGIGSIHGAFIAAMLVGILDTVGRVFLPTLLRIFLDPSHADGAGPALSSMLVYLMMALILLIKPMMFLMPQQILLVPEQHLGSKNKNPTFVGFFVWLDFI